MAPFQLILLRNFILDMKEIKISEATDIFCSIIKQPKTITHKMRKCVSHLKLSAYRFPGFTIKTIIEICDIFLLSEIAFCLKKNSFLCKRNCGCFNGLAAGC